MDQCFLSANIALGNFSVSKAHHQLLLLVESNTDMISRVFRARSTRSWICAVRGTNIGLRVHSLRHNSTVSPQSAVSNELKEKEEESTPWYLRDDTLSPLLETAIIQLPELPQGCPLLVTEFVEALATKYGMSDIEVFDMSQRVTEADEEHLADYNIICTGKSEKHIYKASYELRSLLKNTYTNIPHIEGMVSNAMSPVERRRLLKRAGKGPLKADSDFGLKANSWVMCNTHVDNVFIHILTKDRREQLCLESLWCPETEKEKYLSRGSSIEESDDIFIGIRRNFHTISHSRRRGYASVSTGEKTEALESFLDRAASVAATSEPIEPFLVEVNGYFDSTNLKHHVLRSQIYNEIHKTKPNKVLSQQVQQAILDKYGNLILALNAGAQLDSQRPQDMVFFIEHLLDLPEIYSTIQEDWRQQIDASFDKLSQFTEKIYLFNKSDLELTALSKLIPLLWRLTWIEKEEQVSVTPRMVDEALTDPETFTVESSGEASILLASNRAADVLQLIEYTNKNNQKVTTRSFNELVMFTYGNAGKWNKFWDQWEVQMNLLGAQATPESQILSKWARLTTFLALRNDPESIVHFFNTFWDASNVLSLSFMSDFRLVEGSFASEEEQECVKRALTHMLLVVNEDINAITNYRAVEALISSI